MKQALALKQRSDRPLNDKNDSTIHQIPQDLLYIAFESGETPHQHISGGTKRWRFLTNDSLQTHPFMSFQEPNPVGLLTACKLLEENMKPLHLTSKMIDRLDRTEFTYTMARMSVIRDALGDLDTSRFVEKANLRALMAPEVPNPFFNRILISGLTSAEELAETLGMFESASVVPTIEVSPGGISQTMSLSLFQKGFAQTEFRPVFLHQADCIEAMPPDLETRIVKSDSDLESFKDLYLEGWKTPPFLVPMMRQHISKWVQLPGWSMYLALLDDSPVACAILYCFEDIAYLADAATPDSMRGKGGQTALLHARALAAQQAQMRYVFSRADFGSVSQRNMERLGLRVSYTRSAWSKIA